MGTGMKVIVAGGRNYKPDINAERWLADMLLSNNTKEVVSGTCTGADVFGEVVAEMLGINIKRFYPEWKKYGKMAGPFRNEKMAKYADMCILFPGGKGTLNMKVHAKHYGLKIIEYKE